MAIAHLSWVQHTGVLNAVKPTPVAQTHRIAGTVTVQGTPEQRLVYVFNATGTLARRVLSAVDGTWEVTALRKARYFVVARDRRPEPEFAAVVADNIASVAAE